MKPTISLTISVIISFVILVVPAAASTPQGVTILSDMSGWPNGTFEAFGPAIDTDFLCPAGSVKDVSASTAGGEGSMLVLFVHKHFTCSDGSGSFEMDLNVLIGSQGTFARWMIMSGSGEYVNLHGQGGLIATYTDTGIIDTYTGKLSLH